MNQIDTEALNALDEYTASCSVAIASENPEVPHGTGVTVRYGGQDYILTAAHVLEREPDNEKIVVIGRPNAPLKLSLSKEMIPAAVFKGISGRITYSSVVSISITARLASRHGDDIGALKVQNANTVLPQTIFHNLASQGEVSSSVDDGVSIYGYPGELAQHIEHRITKQRGWAVFPHVTLQTIREISDALEALDPRAALITDFDYPEESCDPRGMSGCGAWSIPKAGKAEIWSPHRSQLLGILSGIYRTSKLLRFVRVERVLSLLEEGRE